jgi:NAD(P)-dependent dehydrogenase (short-subunit alcohol dehydrogenase family)
MNIIVTGASRGIGYETVKSFARKPGNRVLAISRNKERLTILRQECLEEFPQSTIQIIPFDLENFDGIGEDLAAMIQEHMGSLDILINNAGFLVKKPAVSIDLQEAESMLKINLLAPLALIRSLMPLLRKSPNPHVVNIGSMAGVQGGKKFPGLSLYSASKAAVHVLTECLAEEYREDGICFNALALGSVQTEMLAEAFPGLEARLQASDMASYIHDFALNGHRYYNGKILPVTISTP